MSSMDPGLDPCGPAQDGVGLICCGERTAQSAQGRGVRAWLGEGTGAGVAPSSCRRGGQTSSQEKPGLCLQPNPKAPLRLKRRAPNTSPVPPQQQRPLRVPGKAPPNFPDAEGSARLRRRPALALHVRAEEGSGVPTSGLGAAHAHAVGKR